MPNRTIRTTRTGIAAALLLVPVLLTGCSAVGPGSHPSTSHEPSQREMLATMTSCLREKGYDVADDDMRPPAGVDRGAYERDAAGCLKDSGIPSAEMVDDDDPDVAKRAAKVAECMREEGFPDFPDDPGAQAKYEPAGDEAVFLTASERCAEAEDGMVVTK